MRSIRHWIHRREAEKKIPFVLSVRSLRCNSAIAAAQHEWVWGQRVTRLQSPRCWNDSVVEMINVAGHGRKLRGQNAENCIDSFWVQRILGSQINVRASVRGILPAYSSNCLAIGQNITQSLPSGTHGNKSIPHVFDSTSLNRLWRSLWTIPSSSQDGDFRSPGIIVHSRLSFANYSNL